MMRLTTLPRHVGRVLVPPIKCQGIKTKLVPFILGSIRWDEGTSGKWIEPFLGSGVVAFNVRPIRAMLCDKNCHIINLYSLIQRGEVNPHNVREHLEREGEILQATGEKHYYAIRDRFNRSRESLDFLFLTRACFNGVMRFNSKGEFNVPWNHKPERFSSAYVTKIVNQVAAVAKVMAGKQWEFRCCNWEVAIREATAGDFVYMDPPYAGRHTDYYGTWTDMDDLNLARAAKSLPCGFAVSMWKENRFRKNPRIGYAWAGLPVLEFSHFYHVGPSERLRNAMVEALIVPREHITAWREVRQPSLV